jgi:hypothetical protein
VVFRAAAATVGASIPKTLHDANGQPWPAGQAPARLSTEAKPLQAEPEEAVGRAEASIRTSEDAQLVAQGENLDEDV